MFSFIAQAGYTTTVIDFTNDLSILLVGLVTLTALSAGVLAIEALRYHFAQKAEGSTETAPATIEYRRAA
ncbi:MAG: hypothetical protein HOP18_15415 [Deltaproteobacteria bacterium]|nr:hypothetical protein [Deltaproteobacteria bacterium]